MVDRVFVNLCEVGCYIPFVVSFLLCFNLIKMKDSNFINKMLLGYFMIDTILGIIETVLFFETMPKRYIVDDSHMQSFH